MKRTFFLSLLILSNIYSYSQSSRYISTSGEINFSGAKIVSENGTEGGNVMRFAPWFNIQIYHNIDQKTSGFFYGFSLRNIGFIYEKDNEKWKARTYNVGIPLGFKWGNTSGNFVYLGYEFEVPLQYKEKYFNGEDKERKNTVWFSDRVSPYTHAGFIGYNFKGGFNIKFKYYFTEFFNPDFDNSGITDARDIRYPGKGNEGDVDYVAPREYLKVNILYVALTWNMFRKPVYYYNYEKKSEVESVY